MSKFKSVCCKSEVRFGVTHETRKILLPYRRTWNDKVITEHFEYTTLPYEWAKCCACEGDVKPYLI